MIYLITGSQGTGKTCMVVEMILNNYEGLFKMEAEDGTLIDRPLYFCHLDGLDKDKFKAHELTEEQIQSAPLREIVPLGSVVIVDECDYTYPTRSAAKEVPPYIKTLKELRHEGFTLILMTQHPTMIDKYLRNMVGKHIHLERKQIGTKRYEWYRCEENLSSLTFADAVSEWYTPSEEAQKFYKSASKHIKFKKKRSWILYALPVGIIVLAYFVIKTYFGWQNKFDAKPETVIEQTQTENNNVLDKVGNVLNGKSPQMLDDTMRPSNFIVGATVEDYIPRIQSLPETKPIYDNLRQPRNMETIAGCVSSKNSCNCYTEQGTKVYANDKLCRNWAENGIFQVYKDMQATAENTLTQSAIENR